MPDSDRVKAFWQWLHGKKLISIFPSISGLLNGQGLPDAGNSSDKVMQKLNRFIERFGEGKDRIPREHLVHLTSICSGKGVPDATRVWKFWQWLQEKKLTGVFSSISNLLSQQGLPDTENSSDKVMQRLNRFIDLFGKGKDSIPKEHLVRFTSICGGKGVPDATRVWTFWQWLQEKKLTDIFPSISCLLNGCGLPDPKNSSNKVMQKLNRFIDLFGEDEKKIPVQYLSHFTSINSGKGVPDAAAVQAFWQWLQDRRLVETFASISGMLNGQGLPDPNDPEDEVGQQLDNFLALFGKGPEQISPQSMTRFTGIMARRGIPEPAAVRSLYQWLDGDAILLQQMARLFIRKGLPDMVDLETWQQKLKDYTGLSAEDDRPPLQIMTLSLTAPGRGNLPWEQCTAYLERHKTGTGSYQKAVIDLGRLLLRHGPACLAAYMAIRQNSS
ncbi:MAG: hypothetical protein MI784_11560, partial [Cytophagales bacterium]|nr:hypothetical protein [Cytophagales bacterium]